MAGLPGPRMAGSRQSGYEWDRRFLKHSPNGYISENIPFCSLLGPLPDNAREIIETFLNLLRKDPDLHLYQADVIEGFCFLKDDPVDFPTLKGGTDPRVNRITALLDDRNEDSSTGKPEGNCRPRKGALNAHQLLQELSKRRYKAPRIIVPTVDYYAVPGIEVNEPDADRRLLYITNLDRWTLLAIMSTASEYQAAFLRDFICRYLEFKTYIGVRFKTMGFPTFAIEFHIPFYALRRNSEPFEDHRRKSNGLPLRRSGRLNFLNMCHAMDTNNPSMDDCIYEAQISCLITGLSNWSWVAYAMVDTYYKGPDNQDSVEYYAQQADCGLNFDPLTCGRRHANEPLWTPREYFLWLFEARVDQVQQESQNLVRRLLQIVQPYTHDYIRQSAKNRGEMTEDSDLYDEPIRLLQQVSDQLCLTIDALDNFMRADRNYFWDLDDPDKGPSPLDLLFSIEKHASELRILQKDVKYQQQLLERLSNKKLKMRLQLDNTTVASQQQQTSEHVKALTIVALFSIPLSITAAIFSIPKDALPFEHNVGVFCTMTAVLFAILLAILSLTFRFHWYRCALRLVCHVCNRMYRLVRVGLRFITRPYRSRRWNWSLFGFIRVRNYDLESGQIRLGSDEEIELIHRAEPESS